MTLSGLLLGQLSIRQDEKIIKDIGLAAMDLFGTLIAIFIGVGLVSKEIERRSLYPLLAKPLTRDEFLLGKFAGLAFTLLVNVAVMAAGLYLTLLATGRRADPGLLKAVFTHLPRPRPHGGAGAPLLRRSRPRPWPPSAPSAWWWPAASRT